MKAIVVSIFLQVYNNDYRFVLKSFDPFLCQPSR